MEAPLVTFNEFSALLKKLSDALNGVLLLQILYDHIK